LKNFMTIRALTVQMLPHLLHISAFTTVTLQKKSRAILGHMVHSITVKEDHLTVLALNLHLWKDSRVNLALSELEFARRTLIFVPLSNHRQASAAEVPGTRDARNCIFD
jgi:hypothetical protein